MTERDGNRRNIKKGNIKSPIRITRLRGKEEAEGIAKEEEDKEIRGIRK